MKQGIFVLVAVLLMGCSGTMSPDATPRPDMQSMITEATAIAAASESDQARISATVAALEADIAHKASVNQSLHATLQAVSPRVTRAAVNVGGAATPNAILQGRRWFIKTGMSSSVSTSDGCNHSPQMEFTVETARIYATFMAYNIEAGTRLAASWVHNGRTAHEEAFNLDYSSSATCLWFYIDPEIVEFQPGLWSVQLYADGFPLESAMPFNIS